jgi:hypothetical protein
MAQDKFDRAYTSYVDSAGLGRAGVDVVALKQFILEVTLPKARIAGKLQALRDDLAAIEHERWADWQLYQHSQCRADDGEAGALVIPADLVAQWERQAATEFCDLMEKERESDREQVDRYLPFLVERLAG